MTAKHMRAIATPAGFLVFAVIVLLAQSSGAQAQSPAPAAAAQPVQGPLTLDDAVAQALANSRRLSELQARGEAALASEQGRAAGKMPQVSVLGGYMRTNHVTPYEIFAPGGLQVVYPDLPDNIHTRLDVQWPIYTAGRLDALERAARAEHDATGADLEAARADLKLETTRAFWALVTARESEVVLTRSLDSIGAHVRDLRSRLEQGLIPPNDVLTAEAQQSRERLLAIEATTARRVAEADLRRLMGVEGVAPIEPAAVLVPSWAAGGDLTTLIVRARAGRPERQALESRASAATARIEAATAAGRPQVSVGGGYDYARPNPRIFPRAADWEDSWDASVNVSWSLWDGGRNRADRAEAAATAKAAQIRIQDFDRQVAFEVEQRSLELEASLAAIATAEDGVRAAAEARRVVGDRFNAGVATNTDVLDAETDLLQASLDRTRALANARLAEARLARAAGY